MKLRGYQIVGVVLNVLAFVVYFGVYRVFDKETVVNDIAFFYVLFVQIYNLVCVLIRPR